MHIALAEAQQALCEDEVPVGCVIVRQNNIIARSHNLMQQSKNNAKHAEMIALDKACQVLGTKHLKNCDMYVTLEPCTMCAAAISFARIRCLYIGAMDYKGGAVYHNSKVFYGGKGLSHIPHHYNGFAEEESSRILKEFFKMKRNGA